MSRPKGDLGTMLVPKATAAAATPFQAPAPQPVPATPSPPTPVSGQQTALTVKIDRGIYLRLRTYCLRAEERGERVTHQSVAARAIAELLDREGA